MSAHDRLTVEEVETIARNSIYAAAQKEDWRDLGLNIECLARQLADTMRENEILKKDHEKGCDNLIDFATDLIMRRFPCSYVIALGTADELIQKIFEFNDFVKKLNEDAKADHSNKESDNG